MFCFTLDSPEVALHAYHLIVKYRKKAHLFRLSKYLQLEVVKIDISFTILLTYLVNLDMNCCLFSDVLL